MWHQGGQGWVLPRSWPRRRGQSCSQALYSLCASQSTQWELPLMFLMDCRAMASFWLVRRDCGSQRQEWAASKDPKKPQVTQLPAAWTANHRPRSSEYSQGTSRLDLPLKEQWSFGISRTSGVSFPSNRGKLSLRISSKPHCRFAAWDKWDKNIILQDQFPLLMCVLVLMKTKGRFAQEAGTSSCKGQISPGGSCLNAPHDDLPMTSAWGDSPEVQAGQLYPTKLPWGLPEVWFKQDL